MAISVFKSWVSTITRFLPANLDSRLKLLVDPTTGAPVGLQSQNDGGPDMIAVPIDITAAQALNPPAGMVADLNATYRVNAPPYTRYYSDGTELVAMSASGADFVVPAGTSMTFNAPLTISPPQRFIVQGTAVIRSLPA
jgi:hypothetical protein